MKFDTIFHLAGEQILPNYIALRQFECKNHVIIVSEKTKIIAKMLKKFVKGMNITHIEISPYDVPNAHQTILSETGNLKNKNIAFNLTGGTKPMFVAAFLACQSINAVPFYIETTGKTLDFMNEKCGFEKRKLIPVFDSVNDFIKLAGYNVIDNGLWEANPLREKRKYLTQKCWENKSLLMNSKIQNKIHEDNIKKLSIDKKKININIDEFKSSISFNNFLLDTTDLFSDVKEALEFYGGGWFEEFCFSKLIPLLDSGKIKDLRISLKPDFGQVQKNSKKQKVKQEFDISFTDGINFFIIECKAGSVWQAHIQKLENIAYGFGGTFGKGYLASAFAPSGNIKSRIQSSRNVDGVFSHDVQNLKNIL